jgi:hypothetical protein
VSDAPSDHVRELATKLFAAARAERPGPALGRRLSLIQPPGVTAVTVQASEPSTRARQVRAVRGPTPERAAALRSRWAVAFASVAFAAGAFGLWLSSMGEPAIRISAERGSARHAEGARVPATSPELVSDARESRVGVGAVALEPRPTATEEVASAVGVPRAGEVEGPVSAREGGGAAREGGGAAREGGGAAREGGGAAREGVARSPREGARGRGALRRTDGIGSGTVNRATPRVAATSSSASRVPTADAKPMALIDELALLKEARAALRSHDARHALELLDRHAAARTGDGLLAEATLLRIEAFAALGRRDEASGLAERFVRDNPHSALGDRAKSFIVTPDPTAP